MLFVCTETETEWNGALSALINERTIVYNWLSARRRKTCARSHSKSKTHWRRRLECVWGYGSNVLHTIDDDLVECLTYFLFVSLRAEFKHRNTKKARAHTERQREREIWINVMTLRDRVAHTKTVTYLVFVVSSNTLRKSQFSAFGFSLSLPLFRASFSSLVYSFARAQPSRVRDKLTWLEVTVTFHKQRWNQRESETRNKIEIIEKSVVGRGTTCDMPKFNSYF